MTLFAVLRRNPVALLLAIAILTASRFIASGIAFFTILFAALGAFFLTTLNSGETLETLGNSGWLLGPFDDQGDLEDLWGLQQRLAVEHWAGVFDQWPNIGTVVVISATSIMLTVSALEMLTLRDIDINHELRVSGLANLAAGLGGDHHGVGGKIAGVVRGACHFKGSEGQGARAAAGGPDGE